MTSDARTWKTSTYSQKETDWKCVEVGAAPAYADVAVRDSVHPEAGALVLEPSAFADLIGSVRTGAL